MESAAGPDPPAAPAQADTQAAQEAVVAASRFSQQVIEQKERELEQQLAASHSRIREFERELRDLHLQVKLTAEPKKQAMEVLRHKIERQNHRVADVRRRYDVAKKAFDVLAAELEHEERLKQQLCDELNSLVSTSVSAQLDRFAELKAKLDAMQGAGMGRTASAPAAALVGPAAAPANGASAAQPAQAQTEPQRREQRAQQLAPDPQAAAAAAQAAVQQAEAAAARSRHVQLPGRASSRHAQAAQQQQQQPAQLGQPQMVAASSPVVRDGRFAGFE